MFERPRFERSRSIIDWSRSESDSLESQAELSHMVLSTAFYAYSRAY
jgi:hypothetical protein